MSFFSVKSVFLFHSTGVQPVPLHLSFSRDTELGSVLKRRMILGEAGVKGFEKMLKNIAV